jgi:Zn-dependent protease
MRLVRIAGIQVSVHWSWLLVGVIEIEYRRANYSSLAWNIAEYLALFFIVLLHEFGHSLACRQVGGKADRIILWPLGGVAFVDPPPRPGAHLWSIAAGPLVNVVLVPVFLTLNVWAASKGLGVGSPNFASFLHDVFWMNLGLLIFNVLPIYPLDGGQVLRSLLWFFIGPIRSLKAATIIGFIGAAGFVLLAIWWQSIWIGIMAAFLFMNCRSGWLHAKAWSEYERSRR